ncbi:hypothetical protein EDD37DRAFT_608979 [Exophiala viscosa]|uniref:Uncharacterized protein n=1 Tax=Exophiala viscosa TaxID=2486360 RepID=A0AAN6IFJ2_9EURO|nr:hypothetical protein EDD36DRAFT_416663 [Exophiala viscosa]KAI1623958.1 hypothetical protein EDD37DRAFT_608979 [Exophiala viscosa]
MAEPISFAFGAVGFLVTIRNAIEKILLDVDDWNRYCQKLIPLCIEVEELIDELYEWQRFWYIDKPGPWTDSLLEAYWGQNGKQKIIDLLSNVRRDAKEIKEEFRYLYGFTYVKVRNKWRAHTRRGSGPLITAAQKLQVNLQDFKESYKRVQAVLYRNQIFDKHLHSIWKDVRSLQVLAQREFVTHHRRGDNSQIKAKVTEFAAGILLPKVSSQFVAQGEALRKAMINLGREQKVAFDIHLDHGVTPEDRSQMLVESCLEDTIRTQVHARSQSKTLGYRNCFTVHLSKGPRVGATAVSDGDPAYFVALEKAECRAREDVCGCSVHRFEELPARKGPRGRSWCSTATSHPDVPTWRLGLFLLELALDRAVERVGREDEGNKRAGLFRFNGRESSFTIDEDGLLDDEMQVELQDISEDLAQTINICLTFHFNDWEDDATAFEYFYENAVFPLWRHYETAVVKPAKERKFRLAQKQEEEGKGKAPAR